MLIGGYKPDPIGNYNSFSNLKVNVSDSGNIDLREFTSPRHQQRMTSTCVGQSVVKALETKRIIKHGKNKHVDLSVLDIYYGARDLMSPKQTNVDEGTYISLACDVLRRYGVCRDIMHPFKTENIFKKPSILATREAYLNKIQSHWKITSTGNDRISDIIKNLRGNNPVVFGTMIGKDWEDYGRKSKPLGVSNNIIGGHAMVIVGFVNGLFVVENSWGTFWGDNGFGYVTPELLKDPKTSGLWVIMDGSEVYYEK